MTRSAVRTLAIVMSGLFASFSLAPLGPLGGGGTLEAAPQAAPNPAVRQIGTVKAVRKGGIEITTDSGSDVDVSVGEFTRVLRAEPGQKDLKGATPIRLEDIQIGDRILVRGNSSDDGHAVVASALVVIKRTDIEQKQAREREDWQKRGVGGLVKGVDTANGTITISTMNLGVGKSITIHATKESILRRYAPNSVKFDDAKPGTLEEIKPGDQLRARGEQSAAGGDFTAEEIVTGAFRNIAGTISSMDVRANSLTVADLLTNKPVLVRFTPDSSLRKLPPLMAERIAMRWKATQAVAPAGPNAAGQGTSFSPTSRPPAAGPHAAGPPEDSPDLHQALSRLPALTLADFRKGEAVMIVSTQGMGSGEVTAITLVGGVEAILRASPEGSQQMVLSPWSLGASGPETAAQ